MGKDRQSVYSANGLQNLAAEACGISIKERPPVGNTDPVRTKEEVQGREVTEQKTRGIGMAGPRKRERERRGKRDPGGEDCLSRAN